MSHIPKEIKECLGLVHVYTGNGKGKTTASMGLGFRAAGRGLEVLMIQFLKPAENYGEHRACKNLDNFTILPIGLDHMSSKVPEKEDIRVCEEALERARDLIYSRRYDLVILDEVNVAVSKGYLSEDAVIDMLKGRPEYIEIVMTGRGATKKLMEYADLVTEMKLIKHPYDKGIKARKGIEY